MRLEPLRYRTVQIGLGGVAVARFVDEWIVELTDVTDLATEVESLVAAGRLDDATARLPTERPYPLTSELLATIGAYSA